MWKRISRVLSCFNLGRYLDRRVSKSVAALEEILPAVALAIEFHLKILELESQRALILELHQGLQTYVEREVAKRRLSEVAVGLFSEEGIIDVMPGTFEDKCGWLHRAVAFEMDMESELFSSMLREENQLRVEDGRWSGVLHRRLADVLKKRGLSTEDWQLTLPGNAEGEAEGKFNDTMQGDKYAVDADGKPLHLQSQLLLSEEHRNLSGRISALWCQAMSGSW